MALTKMVMEQNGKRSQQTFNNNNNHQLRQPQDTKLQQDE